MRNKDKIPQDTVIKNLDGQAVVNASTGEFLLDFNKDQKDILQYCLEHKIPINGFAYTEVPASLMNMIAEFGSKWNAQLWDAETRDTFCIRVWKGLHTKTSREIFGYLLELSICDTDPFDYIEYILNSEPRAVMWVCNTAHNFSNSTKDALEALKERPKGFMMFSWYEEYEKKRQKSSKLSDFIDKMIYY